MTIKRKNWPNSQKITNIYWQKMRSYVMKIMFYWKNIWETQKKRKKKKACSIHAFLMDAGSFRDSIAKKWWLPTSDRTSCAAINYYSRVPNNRPSPQLLIFQIILTPPIIWESRVLTFMLSKLICYIEHRQGKTKGCNRIKICVDLCIHKYIYCKSSIL